MIHFHSGPCLPRMLYLEPKLRNHRWLNRQPATHPSIYLREWGGPIAPALDNWIRMRLAHCIPGDSVFGIIEPNEIAFTPALDSSYYRTFPCAMGDMVVAMHQGECADTATLVYPTMPEILKGYRDRFALRSLPRWLEELILRSYGY